MSHVRTAKLRRLLGVALLSTSLFTGAALVESSTAEAAVPDVGKVAVVDMQRILNETSAGKSARQKLESASTSKQKKLDKRRQKLEQDQTKLAQLQGDALAQAQEKLQRDYYELQSMYMTLQQELAEQEARTLEVMYANCQSLAKEMAKDFKLDLVLIRDQTTVLYVADGVDLTNEVIKRYDKKYK
ncbi:OmpH family outer membrane protein [Pseudenhygromyxa sp. WMMC2535]|uniref:OmpH family outer membrane protein n=1 Tax=Pseudenhygromyxa sp. WMMC2535 TaxID=2712867 RepID=UPI001555A72A|nr:OmpH family outer membrane protein [Pseudenhygromyxa sp. WMMC2535]NVB41488.1 OmpH family outer membrane protein [Pseudenhygromyxa sp. WMMC2535]